jgi:hypothetical protein
VFWTAAAACEGGIIFKGYEWSFLYVTTIEMVYKNGSQTCFYCGMWAHTGGKRGGTCPNGIPVASHQHLLSLCNLSLTVGPLASEPSLFDPTRGVTDLTGNWHDDSCLCFQNNRHDLQIGQRFPTCRKYIGLKISTVQLWLCKKILSSSAESSKATILDRVFSWLKKLLGSSYEKQDLFTTSIQCPKNQHKSFENAWIRLSRFSPCW